MFGIQNYASFIAAILIFQLIPGPGTLTILSATARNGIAAGLSAVLGTLAGDLFFMTAAVIGLAAVMKTNLLLFQGLQWFGAAYLCWVGWQLLRAPIAGGLPREEKKSGWMYFRRAFTVGLTNPKVVLFFVAFFPLFLRADASPVALAVMMAHVTILSFLYQAMLVLVGNAVACRLSALPSVRKLTTRLAGATLIGFGVKLALSNR